MLTQEDYWMIRELHERGLYRKDISDRLRVHPKTVARALKQGDAPSRRLVRTWLATRRPLYSTSTVAAVTRVIAEVNLSIHSCVFLEQRETLAQNTRTVTPSDC